MAKLVVHHRAARYIQRMDARTKAQLKAKLEMLAKNPATMPGVKPMAGEWSGFYRMRHGDLRVIYIYDREIKQSLSPMSARAVMRTNSQCPRERTSEKMASSTSKPVPAS